MAPAVPVIDLLMSPRKAREARDRHLALKYVEAGSPARGVSVLARSLDVDRFVLARAIRRQGDWAKLEWARLHPTP